MAYNPYFPQTYQPYPQMMTPPTIRSEIVQVDNEEAAANYPVGSGMSQMMIAKDDSAIFVKSATPNGSRLDVFVKRPQAPQKPAFDPSAYVTKEELETRVAALIAEMKGDKE